jgi:N-methylhydantoinase A
MRRVVIPRYPGLFSALGLLAADVRATFSRSLVAPLDAMTLGNARGAAAALTAEARAALQQQGVATADIRTVVEVDLRYAGQSFDLTVPFDGDEAALANAFHQRHERRYGYASRDERVELATVRVTAIGSAGAPPHTAIGGNGSRRDAGSARIGTRRAWDAGAFVEAAIYDREKLLAGSTFDGPAIVEQYDTTSWIPAGWTAVADAAGNLIVDRP